MTLKISSNADMHREFALRRQVLWYLCWGQQPSTLIVHMERLLLSALSSRYDESVCHPETGVFRVQISELMNWSSLVLDSEWHHDAEWTWACVLDHSSLSLYFWISLSQYCPLHTHTNTYTHTHTHTGTLPTEVSTMNNDVNLREV